MAWNYTVAELKEELDRFPDDARVVLVNFNDDTYWTVRSLEEDNGDVCINTGDEL